MSEMARGFSFGGSNMNRLAMAILKRTPPVEGQYGRREYILDQLHELMDCFKGEGWYRLTRNKHEYVVEIFEGSVKVGEGTSSVLLLAAASAVNNLDHGERTPRWKED